MSSQDVVAGACRRPRSVRLARFAAAAVAVALTPVVGIAGRSSQEPPKPQRAQTDHDPSYLPPTDDAPDKGVPQPPPLPIPRRCYGPVFGAVGPGDEEQAVPADEAGAVEGEPGKWWPPLPGPWPSVGCDDNNPCTYDECVFREGGLAISDGPAE